MTPVALNLAIAALPALVFVGLAARGGVFPLSAFYRSFLAGILAVFPALLLMLLVSSALSGVQGLAGDALRAFVVAGLVEEAVKLAPVWWSLRRLELPAGERHAPGPYRRPSDRRRAAPPGSPPPARRLALAVTAGLGFAFMENAFYVAGTSQVLLARAVLAVPLHGAAAAYLGIAIGSTADPAGPPHIRTVAGALALAAVVHGFYDLAVKRAALAAPVVVIAAVGLAVVGARRHARAS